VCVCVCVCVYIYNNILLFSYKEKWKFVICREMDI
jgi:hypothetical protein